MSYITHMRLIAIILLLPVTAFSQLVPFDRLAKDNLNVTARQVSGGASTQNDFRTTWGSYDKTTTQQKTISVSVNAREEIELEFIWVFKSVSEGEYSVSETKKVKDSTPVTFGETAASNDTKYATIGQRTRDGEKIYGWAVRAIKAGRIIGVAGSSDRLKKFAESGKEADI